MQVNSKYFTRDEFACSCGCGFDTVDAVLLEALDKIREQYGPTTITSGCRCEDYNRQIGGSEKSQHVQGRAADIQCQNGTSTEVADYAEELGIGGVGRYSGWTHIDTRTNGPARWGSN